MKRALTLLFLCLLVTLACPAQTFNQNIVPSTTGLDLGRSNQRWDLFARNLDLSGTCSVNGTVVSCFGGGTGGSSAVPFTGTPTGSCTTLQNAIDTTTGKYYSCLLGGWVLVGPGAAGSAAWNLITGGTLNGQALVLGAGSSLTTTGGASLAATTAPWLGLTGFPSACSNKAVTGIGASLTCNTITSAYTDTSIARTGFDINTSFQVTTLHLAGVTTNNLLKANATGNAVNALAADVVSLFSTCSGTQYLGADGACHTAGSGALPSGSITYPLINTDNATGYATDPVFKDAFYATGADACAKMNATSSTSVGGIIGLDTFGTSFTNTALACAGNPFNANSRGRIWFPAAGIGSSQPFAIGNNSLMAIGSGPSVTTIQAQAGFGSSNCTTGWTASTEVTPCAVASIGTTNASTGQVFGSGFQGFKFDAHSQPGVMGFGGFGGQEQTYCFFCTASNSQVANFHVGGGSINDQNGSRIDNFYSLHSETASCPVPTNITISGITSTAPGTGGVSVATATYSGSPSIPLAAYEHVTIAGVSNGARGTVYNGDWQVCSYAQDHNCQNPTTTTFTFHLTGGAGGTDSAGSAGTAQLTPWQGLVNSADGARPMTNGTFAAGTCSAAANIPIGLEVSNTGYDVENVHIESSTKAVGIGHVDPTIAINMSNMSLQSRITTGVEISNQFGEPQSITLNHIYTAGGSTTTTNAILDPGNQNTITTANNPDVTAYWIDLAGYPAFTVLNPADLTNGFNFYNGVFRKMDGGSYTGLLDSSGFKVNTGKTFSWGASASATGDTGISRTSAGVIGFGNGTPGDTSATIKAQQVQTGSTNGGFDGLEGTGAGLSAAANHDLLYPDSANHCWHQNLSAFDKGCIPNTFTAPLANSANGTLSISGLSGAVPNGTTGAFTRTPSLGAGGVATGALNLVGLTAGTVTVKTQDSAGTYEFDLPTTAGSVGQLLTSQGGAGNAMTWTTVAGTGTVTSITATSPVAVSPSPLTTTGTITCTTCATTTNGGALSGTSPVAISAGGAISISGVTGLQGNGALLQLSTGTVTSTHIPVFDANGNTVNSHLQESSQVLNNGVATQGWIVEGGQSGSANLAGGGIEVRGGNQTGAGGASSQGGPAYLHGGNNAATNTASRGGNVQVAGGASTGATSTGLQGLMLLTQSYAQSSTVTQWNLVCFTATAKAVTDCGASPTNIAGVATALSSTIQATVAAPPSEVPVNASAAVTVGHTVCAGTTAGKVTDSGGTTPCGTGVTVGTVIATSGAYQDFPDGTTAPTITTTLPIIRLNKVSASGSGDCAACVVATSPGAGIAHFAGSTQTVTSSAVVDADLSGTVGVAHGGTALSTLTVHALYAGNGASAPVAIGPDASTTKALFAAGSSADPAFRAISSPDLPAALASQTSINGLGITASTGALAITNGKTFSVLKTLTLDGTDGTTMTFPSTSASLARIDGTNTGTSAMTLDMSASTTANSLRAPVGAGLTAGADGAIAYDSTAKLTKVRTNGADSSVVAATGTSTTTTQVLHATAVAGIGAFGAIVAGDLPSTLTSGTAITNAALTTPSLGAATATSVLATGIVDGVAPTTLTTSGCVTGTHCGLGATYKSGYTWNNFASAATTSFYDLPSVANTVAGMQYCVTNGYGVGGAVTGAISVTPLTTAAIVIKGTVGTANHAAVSGGAAGDSACFVAVDTTHWIAYVQSGTWTTP